MKAEDLKNSILQLAMEGKLVPQDPNDEPASVLLDKIREKKEQLIKDKKIKRNNKESFIFRKNRHVYEKIGKNDEPVCIDDEIPFDIPDSWEFCALDNIIYNTPTKKHQIKRSEIKEQGLIPVISQSQIFVEGYSNKNNKIINVDVPTIIFGDHTKNIKYIDFNFIVGADGVKILNPILIYPKFLFYLISFIKINMNDRGYSRHYQFLKEKYYPLPPLEEQKRIVNKIEDILPLIEEYGVNEEKLDKLNSEFPDKLKSSILQEAIQGKLVPQDSNDEPASVLLEKIKEEKEILIKEKKIKRNKNESIIYNKNNHYYEIIGKKGKIHCIDDEIPFDIPNNWNWVKLNNICNYGNFLSIDSKNIADNDWVLDLKDIEKDTGKLINFTVKKEIKSKSKKFIFKRGDVLYSKLRPYLNKVIIAKQDGYCTTEILPLKFYNSVYNYYAQIVLMSPYFVNYAIECSYGTKMPRLGTSDGKNAFFPLPPSNEQIKIVNKVKECFNIIDSFNK